MIVLVVVAAAQHLRPAMAAGLIGAGALALMVPYVPKGAEPGAAVVRIVQPNAPQHEKWDRDLAPMFVERQLAMTASDPGPLGPPALVVWPETAIPYLASVAGPVFDAAAAAAGGADVLIGALRDDPQGRYFNSALQIGPDGQIAAQYDKHHLVPFGEYMPFPGIFRSLGIRALTERTQSGYTPGPGPQVLDLPGIGRALMLICYEAVFPQDTRASTRPDLMIQMTNDAWFGDFAGPQQHLALARMRSIEQGLPLVRAANTGISALIGPRGTVLDQLPLGHAGFVDAVLPQPLPPTVYSRTGDLPLALVLCLSIGALTFWRSRIDRTQPHA
jgi:apolipoprotein N-acyltransferase